MDFWSKKIESTPSKKKRLASKKPHKNIPNAENIGPENEPDRYVIYKDKILGQGACGAVYRGYDMNTKKDVVIKKFKSNSPLGLSPEESYLQEVGCLRYIKDVCEELGLICFIDHFDHSRSSSVDYVVTMTWGTQGPVHS